MERMNKAKSWIHDKWNQGIAFAKRNKRKTAAGLAVASLFITGTALANHYYNANSSTLYHVYVDGQEMGTVDHPDRVHELIQNQIEEQKKDHENLNIQVENQIDFQEEVSLKEKPKTMETLKALEEKIELKVAAQALIINGKPVGYTLERQEMDGVLDELKKKYGPLPLANDKSSTVRAASAPTDSDDHSISFKENIEIKIQDASPAQVLTTDDLQKLIEKGTLEPRVHIVKEGDCLGCIAAQYGITAQDIIRNNHGIQEDTLLQLGQEIMVTAAKPLLTVVSREQVQADIKLDYLIEVRSNEVMYRGDSKVIQQGKEGLKQITYELVKENGIQIEKKIIKDEMISEPVKKIIEKGTKVKPNRGDGNFSWPTKGGSITSGFGPRWGRMHEGLDIAGVSNRTIMAADNGKVVTAGWNGNYGKCVIIDHGNGYKTLYGHLSSISVSVGDTIEKGEKLGVMGTTGESTGVHLHFEILKNGANKNPMTFFRG